MSDDKTTNAPTNEGAAESFVSDKSITQRWGEYLEVVNGRQQAYSEYLKCCIQREKYMGLLSQQEAPQP